MKKKKRGRKGVEGPWANIALFFSLFLFALLAVNIRMCCELEETAFKKWQNA